MAAEQRVCQDSITLLSDERWQDYMTYGLQLYKAALRGDWVAATEIHSKHPECFAVRITKQGDTALHIAAVTKRTDFVQQLVTTMARSQTTENLLLRNNIGNTALCLAAVSGDVVIAKKMVEVRDDLPTTRGNEGLTPLHMAALLGHEEMVKYLLPLTTGCLSDEERISLFISIIKTELYDIALDILHSHPFLAIARDENRETPLHVLAKKPLKSHGSRLGMWSKCCNILRLCRGHKENVQQTRALLLLEKLWSEVLKQRHYKISQLMGHPWRLLFVAVQEGNVEFVTFLLCSYPDLVWKVDDNCRSIFHVAVQYRHEKIFRLIYEIGAIKDLLVTNADKDGNNMLHLAAVLPSSDRLNCISGAALQMQREMLWFKVVEDLLQPKIAKSKNARGETPRTLFTENHKELRKEGEEWMRKTAGSCSVVATLITAVLFGAALKVPGSDNGALANPLSHGAWYWVFAISDSMSLISSTASILMFLSILTSRYAEEDFLQSLPRKLMIGLTLLFISIATMMIAFTAAFHIIFMHRFLWIFIAFLACIPIILFGRQVWPLLVEVYRPTFDTYSNFQPQHQLFCDVHLPNQPCIDRNNHQGHGQEPIRRNVEAV